MHTGLDLGLGTTALVTIDDKGEVIKKVCFGKDPNDSFRYMTRSHPVERYGKYYDRLLQYFQTTPVVTGTIIMEDCPGNLLGNARKLIELKGVYLSCLYNLNWPPHKIFLPVAKQIKLSFTGTGAASKEDMIEESKVRGYFVNNDHEADALAMALMGHEGFLD